MIKILLSKLIIILIFFPVLYGCQKIGGSEQVAENINGSAKPVAVLFNGPSSITRETDIAIRVGGDDIVSYRYKLDDMSLSSAADINLRILKTGLNEGKHTISVIGMNSNHEWQEEANATSRSWTIDLAPPAVSNVIVSGLPDNSTDNHGINIKINNDYCFYKYNLDDSGWSEAIEVSIPINKSGLAAGSHSIKIIVRDFAGLWQGEITFEWVVAPYRFAIPEEIIPFTSGVTTPVPGSLYTIDTSAPGDVEYLAGNLPIIIGVPHGGTSQPSEIPDRDKGCNELITQINDAATIELAWVLVEAIMNVSNGKYPHVIINTLSRTKIDQNRNWGEECNPVDGRGGQAWTDFHEGFTASTAINSVLNDYGKGLYIDLHGKSDDFGEAIMIGYNLLSTILQLYDSVLNTSDYNCYEKSSIRFLYLYNKAEIDFASLLRSNSSPHESFGSLLQSGLDELNSIYDKNYNVVPRYGMKYPLLYYSGEYNIRAFCAASLGEIDNPYGYTALRFISGFQLEVCREIRLGDPLIRADFARKVAETIKSYLAKNFDLEI